MRERGYYAIREAIRERILEGEWAPGKTMPGEVDFAAEYDCARATINRALQSLAEEGIIERKRRAGTRVKELPTRRAKFEIPIVRLEVEARGYAYMANLIAQETKTAPRRIAQTLRLHRGAQALHLETVHLASGRPYAYEDRWVNLTAVPEILEAPLDKVSANEWLVRHVPYSSGEVCFSALHAGKRQAGILGVAQGAALFAVDRTTWLEDEYITHMQLYYSPGYQMRTRI